VDVRGAAVDRPQHERVHQAHDWALRGQHPRLGDLALVVGHQLQPQRLARLLEEQLAPAVTLQRLLHALVRRDHRFHGPAEQELDLVHLQRVVEVAESEHEPSAFLSHGYAAEAHEQLERRLRPQIGIVDDGIERFEGKVEGSGLAPGLLSHVSRS
jgi:hypothetical protein